ncbi:MAG: transcriptional regulator [Betaproteobacteria bacterium RIFCSPLOWO2_12_FULL_65_14]|nr:MAG: transcriptional regulator [Betaproteobacteria bacterium RIFCSPLOWO2_12_FULL_65_14]
MSAARLKRLQSAGWKIGGATNFLQLSDAEAMLVELKLSLTHAVRQSRQKRGLSQIDLAQRMGSSQSRVAKMEAGDPSVSLDLIARAFFASGGTRQELQRAFGAKEKMAA